MNQKRQKHLIVLIVDWGNTISYCMNILDTGQ